MKRWTICFLVFFLTFFCFKQLNAQAYQPKTRLGISPDGRFFTIARSPDWQAIPTYLNGVNYNAGVSIENDEAYPAPGKMSFEDKVVYDLDQFKAQGYNWIRIWVTWYYNYKFEDGTTAFVNCSILMNDANGTPNGNLIWDTQNKNKLHTIIQKCDERGIIVDLTVARRSDIPTYHPYDHQNHKAWLNLIASEYSIYKNIYIDVSNEGKELTADVKEYIDICRSYGILSTYSGAQVLQNPGEYNPAFDWKEFLTKSGCDFISLHLARYDFYDSEEDPGDYVSDNIRAIRGVVSEMIAMNRRVPIHCQEPLRRAYLTYDPLEGSFYRDYLNSKLGGAAGWCFHAGAKWIEPTGLYFLYPHYGFMMNNKAKGTFVEQLNYFNDVEKLVFSGIKAKAMDGLNNADVNLYIFKLGWFYFLEWNSWDEQIEYNTDFTRPVLVEASSVNRAHMVTFKVKIRHPGSAVDTIRLVAVNPTNGQRWEHIIHRSEIQADTDQYFNLFFQLAQRADLRFGVEKLDAEAGSDLNEVILKLDVASKLTLTFPNGGNTLYIGDPTRITWTSEGIADDELINVYLSRNGGTAWESLLASHNDSGAPWTITGPASENCRIRVNLVSNPAVYDDSDAVFAIRPKLQTYTVTGDVVTGHGWILPDWVYYKVYTVSGGSNMTIQLAPQNGYKGYYYEIWGPNGGRFNYPWNDQIVLNNISGNLTVRIFYIKK